MVKNKKWNIFSWLEEIIKTKSDYKSFTPEQWKTFDPYMISLFLSMNPSYIELIDEIQSLTSDKEKLYRIYSNLIPKNNRTYSPYIKSKSSKLNEDKLKLISNLFDISIKESNDYLRIMPKEWFSQILEDYGIDGKEAKNLLKTK